MKVEIVHCRSSFLKMNCSTNFTINFLDFVRNSNNFNTSSTRNFRIWSLMYSDLIAMTVLGFVLIISEICIVLRVIPLFRRYGIRYSNRTHLSFWFVMQMCISSLV